MKGRKNQMKTPSTFSEFVEACQDEVDIAIADLRSALGALGKLLALQFPEFPAPREGRFDAWAATAPTAVLENKQVLNCMLEDQDAALQLGLKKSSWKKYRSHIKTVLRWYRSKYRKIKAPFTTLLPD